MGDRKSGKKFVSVKERDHLLCWFSSAEMRSAHLAIILTLHSSALSVGYLLDSNDMEG